MLGHYCPSDRSSATGSQGQVISTSGQQHLVQFNMSNVPYGARVLEPQVGVLLVGQGPPPKWWSTPRTSSLARPTSDSKKMKESSTMNSTSIL